MSDKPTFESAVALLANKPTPMFLASNSEAFHAGLLDLVARLTNLEHLALEATFRLSALEGTANQTVDKLGILETEHTAYKKRVEVVEQSPAVNDKKIADLETRLRTCEGAIGSANIKKVEPAKVEPAKFEAAKVEPYESTHAFTPTPAFGAASSV